MDPQALAVQAPLVLGKINMLAIFLTIIVPGLGHLYYGLKWKAFFLIILFILGTYFFPLLLFIYPYALYDIWKIVQTKPKPVFSKYEAWAIVSIGIIVPLLIAILWVTIVPPLFKYYKNNIAFPHAVSEEGRQIIDALNKYFSLHGAYPENLDLVVQRNPIRKRWLTDPWGRPYYYSVNESGTSYILMSYGADGIKNTTDDIVLKNYGE